MVDIGSLIIYIIFQLLSILMFSGCYLGVVVIDSYPEHDVYDKKFVRRYYCTCGIILQAIAFVAFLNI